MIKWPRNPREVCGIPNSIVDKGFQAYNLFLLIVQTPVRIITL